MEWRRFNNVSEAREWYQHKCSNSDNAVDAIFLALCCGEDMQAQTLYRTTPFPSRWWADITYMQGHYLIRLRRRDRISELARDLGIDLSATSTTMDPWADLASIVEAIRVHIDKIQPKNKALAPLQCLLGHTYLAMDYHERAAAAYRTAVQVDRLVWIPWENTRLLEFSLAEQQSV